MARESTWQEKKTEYLMLGIFLFILSSYYFMFKNSIISNNDLVKLNNLIISKKPIIKTSSGKSTKKWISLYFKNYEKEFRLIDLENKCCPTNEILNLLDMGDTISIKILKTDLEDLNKFNFIDNFNFNKIYNIENLCNLECQNKSSKNEDTFMYSVGYFVSILLLLTRFIKNQPKTFNINIELGILIAFLSLLFMFVYIMLLKGN